jgi:hypothetical protein
MNLSPAESWIISPSKFWTATIFLHVHLQVVYYNCVKFHKNPISRLGGVVLTRYMDRRTDGQACNAYFSVNCLKIKKCPSDLPQLLCNHNILSQLGFRYLYPLQTKLGGVYRNQPVRPSVCPV